MHNEVIIATIKIHIHTKCIIYSDSKNLLNIYIKFINTVLKVLYIIQNKTIFVLFSDEQKTNLTNSVTV